MPLMTITNERYEELIRNSIELEWAIKTIDLVLDYLFENGYTFDNESVYFQTHVGLGDLADIFRNREPEMYAELVRRILEKQAKEVSDD